MPKKISNKLLNFGHAQYKELNFIKTDFRIEWLASYRKKRIINFFLKELKKKNYIIIYSHEYEFKNKKVIKKLFVSMEILSKNLKLQNINHDNSSIVIYVVNKIFIYLKN